MVNSDTGPEESAAVAITQGCRVTLHFSLSLGDGELIDSNFSGKPATFTVGDGNLPPGFESRLLGRRAGEVVDVVLASTEAFGEPNPGNVHYLDKAKFGRFLDDEYAALTPGTVVAFTDAGGFDLPGVIKQISPAGATVDFNHPLAGKAIRFRAEVLAVMPSDTRPLEIKL